MSIHTVMEKKLIDESCANNVAKIQISEETKVLLLCRAKLSDIYNTVANVVNQTYKDDIDEICAGFSDKFNEFDYKLLELISRYVETISLDSYYTKI